MFQGLSLEQAPPYKVPLYFYLSAALYLVFFGILYSFFGSSLGSRYDYEAIGLTHSFTIGFLSFVMIGSMFQMIPVMLGLAYENVVKNAKIIFLLLHSGLALFLLGFFLVLHYMLVTGGVLLLSGFLHFSFISLKTTFKSVSYDFLVKTFIAAFVLLTIGVIFGFIALLGHLGWSDSVLFGKLHISFILFGWIFMLISAVSYKIIPMFFVAKEFPIFLKEYGFLITGLLLGSYVGIMFFSPNFANSITIVLAFFVAVFAFFSIYRLYKRKRARKDLSVELWYFSMGNFLLAIIAFCSQMIFNTSMDLFIGSVVLFGGIFGLINAMLYKIIPFLTWFHLSSAMVFDAQMHEVIPKKSMQNQVIVYLLAYGVILASFIIDFFSVIGGFLMSLSALLLVKNITQAMKYYDEYIQKKVVFE